MQALKVSQYHFLKFLFHFQCITGVETSGQGYSVQVVLANFIIMQGTKVLLFKNFLHTLHQNSNYVGVWQYAHTFDSKQNKFFSTCRECNPATAAPAVHAVTGAETSTSTGAKQNSPKNPTGAKQNPTRNGNAFLTKHSPTLSKWKLPESCTILQVHRTGQPVWVLLDSKAHYWLRKSGVL